METQTQPDSTDSIPAAPTPARHRGGTPGPLRQLIREKLSQAEAPIALADLVAVSGKPKAEVLVCINNMKVAGIVVSAGRGSYKLLA
jgi:hypothetical protein